MNKIILSSMLFCILIVAGCTSISTPALEEQCVDDQSELAIEVKTSLSQFVGMSLPELALSTFDNKDIALFIHADAGDACATKSVPMLLSVRNSVFDSVQYTKIEDADFYFLMSQEVYRTIVSSSDPAAALQSALDKDLVQVSAKSFADRLKLSTASLFANADENNDPFKEYDAQAQSQDQVEAEQEESEMQDEFTLSACGKSNGWQSGQTYIVEQDLVAQENCFTLTGVSDVTLECASHTIRGDGSGVGVSVHSSSNVVVRNCEISNFEENVRVQASTATQIYSNTLTHASLRAVHVIEDSATLLRSNTVQFNGQGIVSSGSSGLIVRENVIRENDEGILLNSPSLLERNVVCANQLDLETDLSVSGAGNKITIVEGAVDWKSSQMACQQEIEGHMYDVVESCGQYGDNSGASGIGYFTLTSDLQIGQRESSTCLHLLGPSVLDCQDHTIRGFELDGYLRGVGVKRWAGEYGLTVRNCNFDTLQTGIEMTSGSQLHVQNTQFTNIQEKAIIVENVDEVSFVAVSVESQDDVLVADGSVIVENELIIR